MDTVNIRDVENAYLACLILGGRKTWEEAGDAVRESDFYDLGNRALYSAIRDLAEKTTEQINLITVTDHVKRKGLVSEVGGIARVAGLNAPSLSSVSYLAERIRDTARRRQLKEAGEAMIKAASDLAHDVEEIAEKGQSQLAEISAGGDAEYTSGADALTDSLGVLWAKKRGEISAGVSTGFASLDRFLGGFQSATVSIIGARPSVGKTALALSMAASQAVKQGSKVGFFSLEMSRDALLNRLMSNLSHVPADKFFAGAFSDEEDRKLMLVADSVGDKLNNLVIDDTPNCEYQALRSRARKMVKNEGVEIIYIDYFGLIESSEKRLQRWDQMSQISRGLKQLARELNVPIVVLAQVNRDAGKDRPPMIADLRDSGAIEQDADVVILLDDASRRLDADGKIGFYEQSRNEDELEIRQVKAIVAKHRNGSTGAADLAFVATYAAYKEMPRR